MIGVTDRNHEMGVTFLPLAVLLSLAAGLGARAPEAQAVALRPATEVADALQARYDGVRDFSAAFEHRYEGGLLRKATSERGTVQIKKPGKMRWTYETPERKLFVSDGHTMYSYVPADKQVIVNDVPDGEGGGPILFLAGRGNLNLDFIVRYADGLRDDGPEALALALVPRVPQPDYDSIVLVIDGPSLQIRQLETVDAQGGRSTLLFETITENVGIADSSFTFTVPRGVDIIDNNRVSR